MLCCGPEDDYNPDTLSKIVRGVDRFVLRTLPRRESEAVHSRGAE